MPEKIVLSQPRIYQRSYVVPTEELTLTDIKQLRNDAADKGIMRGMAKWACGESELLVREADNVVDFGTGPGGWLTMPLAVVGNLYSVFATAVPALLTPALANNRIAVFYKVNLDMPFPISVDQLLFREGVGAATTYAIFDLEGLATKLVSDGYFTYLPVYDPTRVMNIVVRCRVVTNAQARVRLGCFIIEPTGPVIS